MPIQVEVTVVKKEGVDFANLGQTIKNVTVAALKRQGAFLEQRVVDNVPLKSGDLERSVKARVKENRGSVNLKLLATEPYALRMHEELTPVGPLNLGPGSRAKAARNIQEGGPGGKYMDRVVNFHLPRMQKHLADSIRDSLGRDVVRVRTFGQP